MAKKRKRGENYPKGYIKKQIIRFVCDYPDGIEEPTIREWLKENYGISEKKGIVNHLQELKEKRVLIKQTQTGKENIWKPNPDPEMSKKVFILMMKEDLIDILHEFHKTNMWEEEEDRVSFFFTKYFQGAIEKDFLPFFKNDYGISLIYDKLPKEIRNFIENGIKLSPTAAKHIIIPVPEVRVPVAMLLAARSKNTLKGPDKLSIAITTIYSCLLIDLAKYCSCPVAREKIRAFLEDSNTVSALSDCLDYDLSHFADWLVDNYLSLKAG